MSDAASLRCPHCGANVAPDAQRCPYCRGRLATVSCPSCFALMFEGAKFCPSCGLRRPTVDVSETPAKCPGCRTPMEQKAIGGLTLLECPNCDGVWVTAADFEHLCSTAEAQAAVLHHVTPRKQVPVGRVRYRPCVKCGTMMNRLNFGQISGTVVDVCRGHGTFLDAGELHAIVAFVRDGGLDRAREHKLNELKEQERRLAWNEAKLARESGVHDRSVEFRSGTWTLRGVIELIDLLKE